MKGSKSLVRRQLGARPPLGDELTELRNRIPSRGNAIALKGVAEKPDLSGAV